MKTRVGVLLSAIAIGLSFWGEFRLKMDAGCLTVVAVAWGVAAAFFMALLLAWAWVVILPWPPEMQKEVDEYDPLRFP
jgi:hypothetical protein